MPDKSAVRAEVNAIYEELARRPRATNCIGRADCCHFRVTGKTPYLTKGEAMVAAMGVRASGRTQLKTHPDGACPLLDAAGKCTIYDHRPFGCRTHFCEAAGGVWPRREIQDLIHRLEELDERLGGGGSRPLAAAVGGALEAR